MPGTDEALLRTFVDTTVYAGIIMISTVTTGFAALGTYIAVRESGWFKDFLVSPLSSATLAPSYIVLPFVISLIMTTIITAIALALLSINHGMTIPR